MSWSLKGGEGKGGLVGLVGRLAQVVCPPPSWCCVQGSHAVLWFGSWHLRSGSWQRGGEWERVGLGTGWMQIGVYRMDKQQGPAVYHREL